jgi:serine/threonine-protein kinase
LALAYGQLFNHRLREMNLASDQLAHVRSLSTSSPDVNKVRDTQAQAYQEQAIVWLNRSKESIVLPRAYLAALLAFYQGQSNEALARLDDLQAPSPWFYEAAKLRGDIFFRRATMPSESLELTPERKAQIKTDLAAAREQYVQVADTAQSWPEAHLAMANIDAELLFMGFDKADERKAQGQNALKHLAKAVEVAPDHVPSLILTAMVYRNLARLEQSADAKSLLLKAIEAGQTAVALAPSNTLARKELSMDLRELGAHHQFQGLDPRAPLQQALEVLEKIPTKDQDYYIHHTRALVFITLADHEDSTGAVSPQYRNKAIDELRATVDHADRYEVAWNNLVDQYLKRAARPQTRQPEEDLRLAAEALKRSLALRPRKAATLYREGDFHHVRAQQLRDKDLDERPALRASIDACSRGLAIDPRDVDLMFLEGIAWMDLARAAWERGETPFPALEHAQKAFEQARVVAPKRATVYSNLAYLHTTRAEYLHGLGRDSRQSLRDARLAANESATLSPNAPEPRNNLGNNSRLLAERALEKQGTPDPHLPQALEILEQARADARGDEYAALYLAQTQTLQARARARQGREVDGDFEKADQTHHAVMEISTRPETRLMRAWNLLEWADWRQRTERDARPLLDQGVALLDQVLLSRPSWAEARALHASLRLLRSESPQESARARKDLEDALKDNPNLRFEWEKRARLSISRPTD